MRESGGYPYFLQLLGSATWAAAAPRVGGGDAFSGALIHALQSGMPAQQAVAFATAAGCLKYTVEGDMNLATRAEVAALVARPTA